MNVLRSWLMRSVLFLGLLFVAGGGLLICVNSPPQHRINAESVAKIKRGMTEQHVENVLGVPAGDYGTGELRSFSGSGTAWPFFPHKEPPMRRQWLAQDYWIDAYFDSDGKLCDLGRYTIFRHRSTLFDRIRGFLGL